MPLPPAQLLPFAATTTDVRLLTGLYVLRGWSVVETTGSAAAGAILHDGTADTAPVAGTVGVAQGTSDTRWLSGNGALLRTGLFLEVAAGSVSGVIYYSALTHVDDIAIVEGDHGPYFMRPGT